MSALLIPPALRHVATFAILGPPRTKKTSSRIVRCGKFSKILPSVAHEVWFAQAMTQAPLIRNALRILGQDLPIREPMNVAAVFYRERNSGDLTGFMQALADFLQEPKRLPSGKMARNGAGIIRDDALIVSWDGSRLRKDSGNPRIEVTITMVPA